MPYTEIASTVTVGSPAGSAIPVTGATTITVAQEQVFMQGARDGSVIIRTPV
jgi:hypothetical protein